MRFLDTNVFVRLIAGDDPPRTRASLALFQRLRDGTEEARTTESVVAEVVYVLSSRKLYDMSRDDIQNGLTGLLRSNNLHLEHRGTHIRALDLFAQHTKLDFEDALTIAHMERRGITELYSYDRGFDAVASVTRVEP